MGVHLLAKATVSLVMLTAVTPLGRGAAVWAGASTPAAHRWVQAGIVSIADRPFLYAESKGRTYRIRLIPWNYFEPVRVRVVHRGRWWKASAGRVETPWLRLKNASRLAALELVGGAHATVLIAGSRVSA